MSIQYRVVRRKNTLDPENQDVYTLQAISIGVVDLERISYEISNECTLTKADVVAVLSALGDKMQEHLAEGKTVSLENIGRFKVGFKSKAQPNKELLSKKGISKFHINYQPAPKLKKWLKGGIKLSKMKDK